MVRLELNQTQTDTIPRVASIDYYAEGLKVLGGQVGGGGTFDRVRSRLVEQGREDSMSELGLNRTGYTTGRRLQHADAYTYWTLARDILGEFMLLGYAEDAPLPSKRESVEKYRNSTYQLTEKGKTLLDELNHDYDIFRDMLFADMYSHHYYMRLFLEKLGTTSITVPIYKLGGRVQTERQTAIDMIIEDAAKWLGEQKMDLGSIESAKKELTSYITETLRERASSTLISNGDVVKVANDKIEQLVLRSYGLRFDTVTFDNLVNLCTQFWVVNHSFHVPSVEGQVIFSTARIESKDKQPIIERRRLSTVMPKIFLVIRDEFGALRRDFVSIHVLRAAVCHKLRINDEVFDHVLTGLYHTEYPVDYTVVLLRDLPGVIPPSASPLQIGNKRFYTVSLRRGSPQEGR